MDKSQTGSSCLDKKITRREMKFFFLVLNKLNFKKKGRKLVETSLVFVFCFCSIKFHNFLLFEEMNQKIIYFRCSIH